MRYRIAVSMEVEVGGGGAKGALTAAMKLKELIKDPLVKMAIESAGIRLSGDGKPLVHQPQRTA